MVRRLILTFTLVFLFGLGQQGAIVHQLSHLDDLADSSHQQDKAAHSVCDECLSHSVLAFAIAVDPFKLPVADAGLGPCISLVAQTTSQTLTRYQARAPPPFI